MLRGFPALTIFLVVGSGCGDAVKSNSNTGHGGEAASGGTTSGGSSPGGIASTGGDSSGTETTGGTPGVSRTVNSDGDVVSGTLTGSGGTNGTPSVASTGSGSGGVGATSATSASGSIDCAPLTDEAVECVLAYLEDSDEEPPPETTLRIGPVSDEEDVSSVSESAEVGDFVFIGTAMVAGGDGSSFSVHVQVDDGAGLRDIAYSLYQFPDALCNQFVGSFTGLNYVTHPQNGSRLSYICGVVIDGK